MSENKYPYKVLEDFKKIHKGETILVLGLGPSLNNYPAETYKQFITIGVNDINSHGIIPNYLVFLDTLYDLKKKKRDPKTITDFQADYLFGLRITELFMKITKSKLDRLVNISHIDSFDPANYKKNHIYYANTSTFVALNLAIYMGAKNILLNGIDLHGDTMDKKLAKQTNTIIESFYKLASKHPDVEIYNLSNDSLLEDFKYKTL